MAESILPPEGEQLATGWEPDLRADDTLVRQAVLVHAAWPVEVARHAGRPWRSTSRWAGAWIGLGLIGHPPLMVRFPAPRPSPIDSPVEVREVRDAAGLATAERVLLHRHRAVDRLATPGRLTSSGWSERTYLPHVRATWRIRGGAQTWDEDAGHGQMHAAEHDPLGDREAW